MNRPRHGCAVVAGLMFSLAAARGQFAFTDQNSVSSVSGQFVVCATENNVAPSRPLNAAASTNVIQLQTAFLAVSAERFKLALWHQLGVPPSASWSGRIFLRLRTARSFNETVTITSSPFLNYWNYNVELPDILWKTRYARALSGVLLLELANRNNPPRGQSAEVPPWLVDGMAFQVLGADDDKVLLGAPRKGKDEFPITRLNGPENDFDPLIQARDILWNVTPLTFDQLSWPTDAQMNGDDGGVYYASAQLFLTELLSLKNGHEKLCAMLSDLPNHLNWQTAFFKAFASDFARPLDVEKWWALRVVTFAQHSAGPRWTTDVSVARLQQVLSVPVEFRGGSNALPVHAEISLEAALQNLDPAQRDDILRTKARDLAFIELRLATPFGQLADGYRLALTDFLGETRRAPRIDVANKHASTHMNKRVSVADALKKLNALDSSRREAETRYFASLPGRPPSADR
jgi:hypothetical protein